MDVKLKQIQVVLNNEYPFNTAEEWDNVGFVFGDKEKPVKNVLVALDLTTEVFDKAVEFNVDAIITHHPFLFSENTDEELEEYKYKKDLLERINNTGIGVFHLHTNFDKAKKGMAKAVAKKLKLSGKQVKDSYGILINKEMKVSDIYKKLNENETPIFKDNGINKNRIISSFSIIPGAAGVKDIINHHEAGSEFIITSDIKWSTWLTAKEHMIHLGAVSHGIEKEFITSITKLMKKTFKELGIINIFPKELF